MTIQNEEVETSQKPEVRPPRWPHIEGLIAAPFSPMRPDGSVNLDMIEKQTEFLCRDGVRGAFVCGTTGESMLLTVNERMEIAERWLRAAPKDFKIIVHVGHISLEVSETLLKHAQKIGAWATGAMPPSFFKPQTLEDLVTYCAELADAAPELPFYYYHIPDMTGVIFSMADFLEAAKDRIPNLAGIKYTHDDLMDFELCRMVDGGRFDMLFGRDEILLCALALGSRGAIGCTYNFAAPLYRRLIDAFDSCDFATARQLQGLSMRLVRLLKRSGGSFNSAAKAVMKMRGVDCGRVRLPLRDLTEEQCHRLENQLELMEFFQICPR
jgi:N-acetylneuraminate lyase